MTLVVDGTCPTCPHDMRCMDPPSQPPRPSRVSHAQRLRVGLALVASTVLFLYLRPNSAALPLAACSGPRPVVFAHRAALAPSEAASLDAALPPPGSLSALAAVSGCRFDVDVFLDATGELVVGHPAEIMQRLGFPSEERLATVAHAELRALDPHIALLSDFMRAWAEKCHPARRLGWRGRRLSGGGGGDGGGDAAVTRRQLDSRQEATSLELLIEPKQQAATTRTVALIAAMVVELDIPRNVIGLWTGQRALGLASTASGVLTPLFPIKASTPQDEGDISDVFTYVGPAVNNLEHDLSRRGTSVITWTVDTEEQARTALEHPRVVGIVSNQPRAMRETVGRLCAG